MAATRASGTNAVRYGTMRENVLALTVVTADGRLIRHGRARASPRRATISHGSSWAPKGRSASSPRSRCGSTAPRSDGRRPPARSTPWRARSTRSSRRSSRAFRSRASSCSTTIDAVNRYSKLSLPLKSTLFLEFHGTDAGAEEQAETVQALAAEHGGGDFEWAGQAEERSSLWQARHDAPARPSPRGPAAAVRDRRLRADLAAGRVHPRDAGGHLATSSIAPSSATSATATSISPSWSIPTTRRELDEAERLNERLVMRALAMDGTCTGEHGVGIGKIKFLDEEHGEAASLMRAIKPAFDPDNIMNPGKILGPIN